MERVLLLPEIESLYIVPAIRKVFAQELKKRKISQKNIAEILGISEAAVCHYVKGKRGNHKLPAKFMQEIQNNSKDVQNIHDFKKKVVALSDCARKTGVICSLCSKLSNTKGCTICNDLS